MLEKAITSGAVDCIWRNGRPRPRLYEANMITMCLCKACLFNSTLFSLHYGVGLCLSSGIIHVFLSFPVDAGVVSVHLTEYGYVNPVRVSSEASWSSSVTSDTISSPCGMSQSLRTVRPRLAVNQDLRFTWLPWWLWEMVMEIRISVQRCSTFGIMVEFWAAFR
jgi:hypothetical protein